MSFANPTPIRIGMSGTFNGVRYRVAGRIVMGMEDAGETYYWNEFNLEGAGGESATLVCEETESGNQWRLFTMFEPEYPMTAGDAATKRVGDRLNLEGTDVRVTLVDESRVHHIEGHAPEGVEVGDVAHYFNAESGGDMVVVSWTGDEVEYYRGVDLNRGTVASAFNLRSDQFRQSLSQADLSSMVSGLSSGTAQTVSSSLLKFVGAILVAAIAFSVYSFWRQARHSGPVVKAKAPPAPLVVGASGRLGDDTFRVQGHAVAEIAEVGRRYERHEYDLLDGAGNPALLVCGLEPKADRWVLYKPLDAQDPLTPVQAAAFRPGDAVIVDGLVASVNTLFQSVIRRDNGTNSPGSGNSEVLFCFSAAASSSQIMARWDEKRIGVHRGRMLPARETTAAFDRKPAD